MNLQKYKLQELFLTALKSEVESNIIYSRLAKQVKNALLKDKLMFLAQEEAKHQQILEHIFQEQFPKEKIILPKKTVVPLPEILFPDEDVPLSKIIASAMNAEQAAHDFYQSLAETYKDNQKIRKTLLYFAQMELGHYKLLELEKQSMESYEEADIYLPMVHAGP